MSEWSVISTGYQFVPTDHYLIKILREKVQKLPLSHHWMRLKEYEIYSKPPWDIISDTDPYWRTEERKNSKFTKKTIHVFAKLTTVSSNSNRISRKAGNGGTWREQHKTEIVGDKGQIIGSSKRFTFIPMEKVTTRWIMHEYSLAGVSLTDTAVGQNNIVLCKITKRIEDDRRHVQQPAPPQFGFSTSGNEGGSGIQILTTTKNHKAEPSHKRPAEEYHASSRGGNHDMYSHRLEDMEIEQGDWWTNCYP